jgi:hypothetical protein
MSQSILFSLITAAGACLSAGNVFAGGNAAYYASSAAYVASCAAPTIAAPAAPADPHAGMQMSQGSRGTSYQSFSYEPGTTVGVVPRMMSAPAPRTSRQPSTYNSFRGDRKALGQF